MIRVRVRVRIRAHICLRGHDPRPVARFAKLGPHDPPPLVQRVGLSVQIMVVGRDGGPTAMLTAQMLLPLPLPTVIMPLLPMSYDLDYDLDSRIQDLEKNVARLEEEARKRWLGLRVNRGLR